MQGMRLCCIMHGMPGCRAMDSPAMSRRDSAAATRFDLSAGAMVRLEGGGSVRSGRRGHDKAGGTGPVRSGHQGHVELDPAAGAMARLEGRARNDNSVTSSSPSSGMMGSSNWDNVESSIVYASMNEDDNNNSSNGAAGPAQEGLVSHAILSGDDEAPIPLRVSFVGRLLHRSRRAVGAQLWDCPRPIANILSALSSSSTAQRPATTTSTAVRRSSQYHRSVLPRPATLHRTARSPINAGNANNTSRHDNTPFDSLSQAENLLRSLTNSIGGRIPKTPWEAGLD